MKKIVIGLSGGMDSTTLLGFFLDRGYEVHCCNFQYGSKHNPFELQAFNSIIEFYKQEEIRVIPHIFNLHEVFSPLQSNLLMTGGDIPEGHYNDANMKKTIVPGRNLIFASIMAALAESIGANVVALGVHSGDHHIYPDCRPEFIECLADTIKASTDYQVGTLAPFTEMNKADILVMGNNLEKYKVPYHLTRTCYKNQELSCGKCGSCRERLEAFETIGIKDPINYE